MLTDKAVANLTAGDILLDRGLADPAASRYYYAMYQAAVYRLGRLGFAPGRIRSGAVEWDHSMVENNAGLLRGNREDRIVYREVRLLRQRADYRDTHVMPGEIDVHRERIRRFVEDLVR